MATEEKIAIARMEQKVADQGDDIKEIKTLLYEIRGEFGKMKSEFNTWKGAGTAALAIITALAGLFGAIISDLWNRWTN